jgi:Anti-sigma factor
MPSREPPVLPPEVQRMLAGAFCADGMPAPPARLLAAILARIAAEPGTAHPADSPWLPMSSGVEMRNLADDGLHRTWLARLAPRASIPAHDHPGNEECFVIEGSVYLDDELLPEGGYQLSPAGSRHERVLSPDGCLLLVRSPSLTATS